MNGREILIVDDVEHVRQGLRTILQFSKELTVVGEASNGLEAIDAAEATENYYAEINQKSNSAAYS